MILFFIPNKTVMVCLLNLLSWLSVILFFWGSSFQLHNLQNDFLHLAYLPEKPFSPSLSPATLHLIPCTDFQAVCSPSEENIFQAINFLCVSLLTDALGLLSFVPKIFWLTLPPQLIGNRPNFQVHTGIFTAVREHSLCHLSAGPAGDRQQD